MATTVRQILDAAYGTSSKNRPGDIATEDPELVQVVQRSLRGYFSDAVEVNRSFYAKRITVPWDAGLLGWVRPDEAEAIIRLELADGTEVVEVPFDDRDAEVGAGIPAVYSLGQNFYPAGNAGDPTAVSLVMFYSARPRDLTALTGDPAGTIDPLWPEQFNELLIRDVAIYLAVKDGQREAEVAAHREQHTREYERYISFLGHETTTRVRNYGHGGMAATERVQPT